MLKWNVFYGDWNGKKIDVFNIFNHGSFLRDCAAITESCSDDKDAFRERLKSSLRYYFWCKCEWEIVMSGWPSGRVIKDRKVDVYTQVESNWDIFFEYVWSHREEFKDVH